MIAAFFDVEGTLYTAHMWRGLVKYANEHGRRLVVASYSTVVMSMYALHKLKLASDESLRRTAIARMGGLVAGWTLEEANAAFDWIVREHLLPTSRANVVSRLQEHLAQGHAVILVSGMPLPCLELVGQSVGATGVIGTPLEVKDGRYTGRVIPPVVVGAAKKQQMHRYLQERGLQVDWDGSYAYADSIHDRDMMEMVGHPVAVHPDSELLELAYKQQWQTIGG